MSGRVSARCFSRRKFITILGAGVITTARFSKAFAARADAVDLDLETAWLKREYDVDNIGYYDDVIDVTRAADFLQIKLGLKNIALRQWQPGEGAPDGGWRLVRAGPGPVSIAVIFPPQNLTEEAAPAVAPETSQSIDVAIVRSRLLSRSSRIVFSTTENGLSDRYRDGLHLTLSAIFDRCSSWEVAIPDRSTLPKDYASSLPADITSIEYPTRLKLAPEATTAKVSSAQRTSEPSDQNKSRWGPNPEWPSVGDRTVLWGLDLSTQEDPGTFFASRRTPIDPNFGNSDAPIFTGRPPTFTSSKLTLATREALIKYTLVRNTNRISSDYFRLTSLGARAAISFNRIPSTNDPLKSYELKSENGRDVFEKLVMGGYLLPYGFRAEYVVTTLREPAAIADAANPAAPFVGEMVGALVSTATIQLVDTDKDFTEATDTKLRAVAASHVTIGPKKSPPLAAPVEYPPNIGTSPIANIPYSFVPAALDPAAPQGTPYSWCLTFTDPAGGVSTIHQPLLFMTEDAYKSVVAIADQGFNKGTFLPARAPAPGARNGDRVRVPGGVARVDRIPDPKVPANTILANVSPLALFDLGYQLYTYVQPPPPPAVPVDPSTFRTENALKASSHLYHLTLNTVLDDAKNVTGYQFITTLLQSDVVLPAATAVGALPPLQTVPIKLVQGYLDTGVNHVYAELIDQATADLANSADAIKTGFVSMRTNISAISSKYGALVGQYFGDDASRLAQISDFERGTALDLSKLLDNGPLSARILGLIDLAKMLENLGADLVPSALNAPGFPGFTISQPSPDGAITVRYNLQTRIAAQPSILGNQTFFVSLDPDKQTIPLTFTAAATIADGVTTRSVDLELGAFGVYLPPDNFLAAPINEHFIVLKFSGVSVKSQNGSLSVQPHFNGAELNPDSVINFLSWLSQYFSDESPFSIDLTSTQIGVDLDLGLNGISFGAFAIENLLLTVGAVLPLNADNYPSLELALASMDNPFALIVYFLGGGGWFRLLLSPWDTSHASTTDIAGGINVSAEASIDLFGVVEGSVGITAGAFFDMAGSTVTFGGVLSIFGSVEVFGLIGASMCITMLFEYTPSTHELYGSAVYSVEVHMFFFSLSFSASVSYSFPLGGSGEERSAELVSRQRRRARPKPLQPAARGNWYDKHVARKALFV